MIISAETMAKMKSLSIKEWLETLPEPYKSEAIAEYERQYSEQRLYQDSFFLSTALMRAFYWEDSTQGLDYWLNILLKAQKGEFNTSPSTAEAREEFALDLNFVLDGPLSGEAAASLEEALKKSATSKSKFPWVR